jgi:hypothetical protein
VQERSAAFFLVTGKCFARSLAPILLLTFARDPYYHTGYGTFKWRIKIDLALHCNFRAATKPSNQALRGAEASQLLSNVLSTHLSPHSSSVDPPVTVALPPPPIKCTYLVIKRRIVTKSSPCCRDRLIYHKTSCSRRAASFQFSQAG